MSLILNQLKVVNSLIVPGTITTSGNVGINTTTPQTKLDVFVGANNTFAASFGHNVGAGSFSGFSFGYQEQGNLNYRKSAWVFERTDGHGQGNNASGKIHLLLRNDGTSSAISLTDSVMTIDSDASGTRSSVRVGIGTTSPNAKLQVNGGMTFGYGSDAAFYTGTEFDSSKYLILQNNTDSYGRIGLAINAKTFNGANTPSANDGWAIDTPRSGIRFRAWLTGDADYQTKFTIQHLLANAQNANGDLGIFARGYSTSSPAFLLTGAGNVGIGTTSPGHKLEVSGNTLVTKLFVNSANASYDLYNNGTSYFNSTVAINSWLYLNQNYGHSIVGLYDSTKYQGIFAMGDNYKLPAGGATTGTLYGLAWSHPNAGGVAANLNTHGMLVMENGTFLAAVSGSVRARDDMRAPIFYDSNDTGYFCNPNGASNFYDLNFGGKLAFRQLSTNTVYGPNIYWGITQPNGVKLYYDEEFEYSSNSIQVYNNNGGTAVTITRKNSSFLDGHTQVPNSTGYVLEIKHDPATSSGTSPYNGGWYFATNTGAGKAFLCVFKMKIPSGRNISFHSNSTGTNSAVSWITNLAGTGQYEDYAIIVNSGTASWSSTFFFAIDGAATLFYTYLASATVYELTNVNDKVIGGNLGIGIASPNYRLRIDSGSDEYSMAWNRSTSKIWAIGADSNGTYFSNRTDSVLPIYIANAGNVGIGTSSVGSGFFTGTYKLDINGSSRIAYSTGSVAGATIECTGSTGSSMLVMVNDTSHVPVLQMSSSAYTAVGSFQPNMVSVNSLLANGLLIKASNATGYIDFASGGTTTKMRLTAAGDLAIGTTSPTTGVKLDVVGNIGIQSENSLRLYSSTNYSRIYASSSLGLVINGRFNGSFYNMVITAGSSSIPVLYALTDGRVNISPDGYDTLCSGLLQASSVQALNGSVSDQYGNLRALPENAKSAAYTLAASDTGRLINITTGGVTVPASVFSIGQVVTIYNNSASNQTITQGASVTMYLSGTATTGNRTLAQRGVATVICVASNTFVISGSGLT